MTRPNRKTKRHCLACGVDISTKNAHAKFCKQVCYNKYNRTPEKANEYARNYRKRKKALVKYENTIRGQAKMAGFRSGFERTLDIQLKQSGCKYEYEKVKLPYSIHADYVPDFVLSNGIIIEAKGKLDEIDRRKMLAVKKQHPELDIRFVFMAAHNRIVRGKQTNAEWAEKNGFPWAHKEIPLEWTK